MKKLDSKSRPITVPAILSQKGGQKITALTAYDFTTARLVDRAGVDIVLVGDSLASVVKGEETTLSVTLDEIIYHAKCVARGLSRALLLVDLPFMSYQVSIEQALISAGRVMKETGASAVKLEGGIQFKETVEALTRIDIPVMGHVGLTPQSYHRMGGHKLQGKDRASNKAGSWSRIVEDAISLQEAGAFAVVLEGIPADLASEITAKLEIPTIGIGAGPDCDGQILVVSDMLGLNLGPVPSFVKKYADLSENVIESISKYVNDVQTERFPESKPIKHKALA